jgi:ribonuclease BN (tRNA processing enzyme)
MYLYGGDEALLIDCGASSLIGLRQHSIDPNEIGWVLISHLHGDHFGGVPFLVLDGQFRRRTKPLILAGPPGIQARVEAAMDVLFPGSVIADRRFQVRFVELVPRQQMAVGPAVVAAVEVDHASGAPSLALRVSYAGKTVAYSGDTAWTDALVDVSTGADLFVCEAYFRDKQVPYHLDLSTLLAHRTQLSCARLVVTHMHSDLLDRNDEVACERAHDGLDLSL